MSAEQSMTRAQERNYRNINVAVDSGLLPELQNDMNVTLKTLPGGSIKLVSADGAVTPEGLHYYNNAGVTPNVQHYVVSWVLGNCMLRRRNHGER